MTIGKSLPASSPPAADPAAGGHPPQSAAGDHLAAAGWLAGAATAVVLLAAAVAVIDGVQGIIQRPAAFVSLYQSLGLDTVALTPAGRREREPGLLWPAIDWRYLPSLPERDPALIRLLGDDLPRPREVLRP